MVSEAVRRHLNRPAKIAGLAGLFCYLCLGYFLKIMNMHFRTTWKEEFELLGHFLEKAHFHGVSLSFLLLFYAFFVEVSSLSDRLKRIGAYLAIGGFVLMPLSPLTAKMPTFFGPTSIVISHLAVVAIISAIGILVWGHIRR